jgi:5-formyltetrahydrofolate cyclo-ligase
MTSKADIRRISKQRLAALSDDQKRTAARALCSRLLSDPGLNASSGIGIYLALPDEPDLQPAYAEFLKRNIPLALPWQEADGNWIFRSLTSLDITSTGPFDLPFPEKGDPIPVQAMDTILVPGRAFTSSGDRIGRGKGIYDQLLAGTNLRSIGIGFPGQIFDRLPTEAHDIRLNEVWVFDH